jgi:anti-sigma28 factor (negative regulator of flagellin synthesis)
MRVSAVEMQRAHDLGKPIDDVLGAGLHNNVELAAEGRAIAERLSEESDVREDIIESLRERIEAGTYNVTGAEIADMIFRRAVADRIR